MTIKEYQEFIWGLYKPEIRNNPELSLLYLSCKLLNEVSEIWEVSNAKKTLIEKCSLLDDELGDVAWYVFQLCTVRDIPINIDTEALPSVTTEQRLEPVRLTVQAGKLSGLMLKKYFHNKLVSDREIDDLVKSILDEFIALVGNELLLILSHNMDKLSQRHGGSYNAGFYRKTD